MMCRRSARAIDAEVQRGILPNVHAGREGDWALAAAKLGSFTPRAVRIDGRVGMSGRTRGPVNAAPAGAADRRAGPAPADARVSTAVTGSRRWLGAGRASEQEQREQDHAQHFRPSRPTDVLPAAARGPSPTTRSRARDGPLRSRGTRCSAGTGSRWSPPAAAMNWADHHSTEMLRGYLVSNFR